MFSRTIGVCKHYFLNIYATERERLVGQNSSANIFNVWAVKTFVSLSQQTQEHCLYLSLWLFVSVRFVSILNISNLWPFLTIILGVVLRFLRTDFTCNHSTSCKLFWCCSYSWEYCLLHVSKSKSSSEFWNIPLNCNFSESQISWIFPWLYGSFL